MNNVLVPTDFSAESVRLAEHAIRNSDGVKVNIILFHAFEIPFYISDLLLSNARPPYYEFLTENFRLACKQLKDEFPKQIGSISFKCMHGHTIALFRNFIDANEIDMIVCPGDYVYRSIHNRSVDPRPLFQKSGIPVVTTLKRHQTNDAYSVADSSTGLAFN